MKPISGAERRNLTTDYNSMNSVEAMLEDTELSPLEELDMLKGWGAQNCAKPLTGYGRIADAVDLGFLDPKPYFPEVQQVMVELYRQHRVSFPNPLGEAE